MFENRVISFSKRQRVEHPIVWNLLKNVFKIIKYKEQGWDYYERHLKNYYGDVHSSCIANNNPSSNEYDLQIIIPVFNGESTLKECIESVVNQVSSYSFMVTIVNDGSTDQSYNIALSYQQKNVEIISQENGGLSAARNAALKQMSGKYLLFLDSDDRLTPGSIDALMSATKLYPNADIIEGGYHTMKNGCSYEQTICYNNEFPASRLNGYPWGKIIKSELFSNIQWPVKYWFEDTLMHMVLFFYYQVASIDYVVYDYRINPTGIVHQSFGNIKSLDTYYITRQLLVEKGDSTSSRYYDLFLKQVLVNKSRIESIPSSYIAKSVFFQTCQLRDRFFKNMRTKNCDLKVLEKCLLNRNYLLYSII